MIEEITTYKGFSIRKGTYDKDIVNEVKRNYAWMRVAGEKVLDVGGCFGGYASMAASKGASEVWCFEPDTDNYRMVVMNCGGLKNVKTFNKALVAGNQTEAVFYKTTGVNKGSHSLIPFRGREKTTIRCQNFSEVLQSLKPSVIKMDCEGSEYELLKDSLPDFVKKITIEIHLSKKEWKAFKAKRLVESFSDWHCVTRPNLKPSNWHTMGAWER